MIGPRPAKHSLSEFPGFRLISGFSRYAVSNDGRIVTLIYGREIILQKNKCGYLYFGATSDLGERKIKKVHIAVAEAFIGPRPDKMYVCHNDGNKLNNLVNNLRYDTPEGNWKDRINHGDDVVGENNGRSKLSETDVMYIRNNFRKTKNNSNALELAKKFGVSRTHIYHVVKGHLWTHL